MLAMPIYSLQVLDRVISSFSVETLLILTGIVVFCYIFYGALSIIRSELFNRTSEWLERTLSSRLLENSITLASLGHNTSAGQLQRDLTSVKNFITNGLGTLFDTPWALIFMLVIYLINPVLGFVSLIAAVLLLGFAILTELSTKEPLANANNITIKGFGIAETANRNAEAVEAMGMIGHILGHWQKHTEEGLGHQVKATSRSSIILNISRSLRMLAQVSITAFGGFLVLNNQLTVGGMIASSILAGRALAPFEGSIAVWKGLISAREAYARMNASLSALPNLRGDMDLPVPDGHLQVEQLIYRHHNAEKPTLKGINFELLPGETLGLIGPSAAGKSTLAKLIIGILPPTSGTARLDGAETFKWNREKLGPHVGYLPQDVEIFAGTVKDNIARMDPNAPADMVIEAAKKAAVHEMILRLPDGYETQFNPKTPNLSPGQRQRVGLARALYGDPKFIVLDEPNSNLDSEGEQALIKAIQGLKSLGVTTIIVAHRPSAIVNADKILMLRDGLIERFGERDEVLQHYVPAAAKKNLQSKQKEITE
jgi:ATP-binding cassette subfamily C protein